MKNLSPLLYVLALYCTLISCSNSQCKKEPIEAENLEIQYSNDMMDYIDDQIDNGILFGEATRTVQICCNDTFSVLKATWIAEDTEVCGKREIQMHIQEVSREDIRNKFLDTDSLKGY